MGRPQSPDVVLPEKNNIVKYNILIVGIILSGIFGCGFEGGTSKPMQEDFDKIRLDHILFINSLIKEYKTTKGKYPFETNSEQLPVIVAIQTELQKETHKDNVPIFLDLATRAVNGQYPKQPPKIDTRTVQEFEALLSEGLHREVVLPKDPQNTPMNKPSVYIYTYYLNIYDVTAFLHHDLPFTRNLSPYNNKITVGNRSLPEAGIWTPENLIQQDSFRIFFLSKFNKGGYELKNINKAQQGVAPYGAQGAPPGER